MELTRLIKSGFELPNKFFIDKHLRFYRDSTWSRFVVWMRNLLSHNNFDNLTVAQAIDRQFGVNSEWINNPRVHDFMERLKERVAMGEDPKGKIFGVFNRIMIRFPRPLSAGERNALRIELKIEEVFNTREQEVFGKEIAQMVEPYEHKKELFSERDEKALDQIIRTFISKKRLARLEEIAGKGVRYCWRVVLKTALQNSGYGVSPWRIREGKSFIPKERFGLLLGGFGNRCTKAKEEQIARGVMSLKTRFPGFKREFLFHFLQERLGEQFPTVAELIEEALRKVDYLPSLPFEERKSDAIASMLNIAEIFEEDVASRAITNALHHAGLNVKQENIAWAMQNPEDFIEAAERNGYCRNETSLAGAFDILLKQTGKVSILQQETINQFLGELQKQIPLMVTSSTVRWNS
ncbi:MAG: hypothetical protein KR126chlam1_00936 [Chlamydiae bacterium]|nr:hypothetical protein [Chlamydiota bacterium]